MWLKASSAVEHYAWKQIPLTPCVEMQSTVQSAALWAGWTSVSAEQPLARLAWARAFSWYKSSLRGQDEIPSSRETLSCPKPQCPYQNFLPLSGPCFRTPWLWPWDQMGLDGTSDQRLCSEGTQIGICECTGVESAGFLGRNFLVMSAVSDENLSWMPNSN